MQPNACSNDIINFKFLLLTVIGLFLISFVFINDSSIPYDQFLTFSTTPFTFLFFQLPYHSFFTIKTTTTTTTFHHHYISSRDVSIFSPLHIMSQLTSSQQQQKYHHHHQRHRHHRHHQMAQQQQQQQKPPPSSSTAPTRTQTQTQTQPSTSQQQQQQQQQQQSYPIPKPPTKKQVGNAGWTLIHSIAANFPETPTDTDRIHANAFLTSIAKLYPCKRCRRHFGKYITASPPDLSTRQSFMLWACRAHNDVNRRNGKRQFPCHMNALEQRWGDCGCQRQSQ